MNTQFPIYIISKGRWERRQTARTLDFMGVDFRIVVEPSEREKYSCVIDESKILTLPTNFSEIGLGSVPARNWVWEHSQSEGHLWHWILDDNIESVEYYNNNMKIKCKSAKPFIAIEDFVLRYENIAQAGMHYSNFCPASEGRPPIQFNTRIYSCILIRNDTGYKWRGKFNEDTDLSLRMLKDGWSNVIFRTFTVGKRATMCQKGGNTDSIYNSGDERLEFAMSLKEQHPDVVDVIRRFGRWHHLVNYKPFARNDPLRVDFSTKGTINNYGLQIKNITHTRMERSQTRQLN